MERITPVQNSRTHVRQPSRMLKRMAYQMMSYPLVYMVIWTIPTIIRIYQAVTGKPAPFGIATVDKVKPLPLILMPCADDSTGLHCHPRLCRCRHLRRQ